MSFCRTEDLKVARKLLIMRYSSREAKLRTRTRSRADTPSNTRGFEHHQYTPEPVKRHASTMKSVFLSTSQGFHAFLVAFASLARGHQFPHRENRQLWCALLGSKTAAARGCCA